MTSLWDLRPPVLSQGQLIRSKPLLNPCTQNRNNPISEIVCLNAWDWAEIRLSGFTLEPCSFPGSQHDSILKPVLKGKHYFGHNYSIKSKAGWVPSPSVLLPPPSLGCFLPTYILRGCSNSEAQCRSCYMHTDYRKSNMLRLLHHCLICVCLAGSLILLPLCCGEC